MRNYAYTPFRKRRNLELSYAEQGLIYFTCLNYKNLCKETQEKIITLCRTVGAHYEKALFEKMTTGDSSVKIAQRHYMSLNTLYVLIRRFFQSWQDIQ